MKVPDERLEKIINAQFMSSPQLPEIQEMAKELQSLRKMRYGVEEAIKEIADFYILTSYAEMWVEKALDILKKHVSKYLE